MSHVTMLYVAPEVRRKPSEKELFRITENFSRMDLSTLLMLELGKIFNISANSDITYVQSSPLLNFSRLLENFLSNS